MAERRTRRTRNGEREGDDRGAGQRRGRDGDDREEGQTTNLEPGDTVRIHEAYLEERLRGGASADADAYRRAREQFLNLPGAQRATPPVQADDTEDNPPVDGPTS